LLSTTMTRSLELGAGDLIPLKEYVALCSTWMSLAESVSETGTKALEVDVMPHEKPVLLVVVVVAAVVVVVVSCYLQRRIDQMLPKRPSQRLKSRHSHLVHHSPRHNVHFVENPRIREEGLLGLGELRLVMVTHVDCVAEPDIETTSSSLFLNTLFLHR
jgi:hypothetical protein